MIIWYDSIMYGIKYRPNGRRDLGGTPPSDGANFR